MEVLVLAEGYPSPDNLYNLAYIHSRALHYVKSGAKVRVLSFQAPAPYSFEGIEVINLRKFLKEESIQNYDLVLSHAPNLRNHIKFLLKYMSRIKKVIFFIHGHEVLIKENYYPTPFHFQKSGFVKRWFHRAYDEVKVILLKQFFNHLIKKDKLHFVFVSEWMKEEFLNNVRMPRKLIEETSSIINNNINPAFLESSYSFKDFWGDFVTIRPLDNSKYCIDLVLEIALQNPELSFHIYGRGDFFKYNKIPGNVVWHDRFLRQNEIPNILNHYRCGLMPTRLDAQGVTMCEFACYGIPLYVSDLPVCREMLGSFQNVRFFFNDEKSKFKKISLFHDVASHKSRTKFSTDNTVDREIKLLKVLKK